MKTADQVYRLRIFLFSFAILSKCQLSLEALVEILTDRDSDLSDLDEESDFTSQVILKSLQRKKCPMKTLKIRPTNANVKNPRWPPVGGCTRPR